MSTIITFLLSTRYGLNAPLSLTALSTVSVSLKVGSFGVSKAGKIYP
ncbi:MAG: hypothetical protein V7K61_29840 [Nostoc sp.]